MDLKQYLNNYERICWYPSAGLDLRPILYLTPGRAEKKQWEEKDFPDCFIFTDCGITNEDCNDWFSGAKKELFHDRYRHTDITINKAEELQRIEVAKNRHVVYYSQNFFEEGEFVNWPPASYGRVVALNVHISCNQLGEWDTTVIYVMAENAAFAMEYLLPEQIKIDMIYRINYGYRWAPNGFGSRSNGLFITKLLQKLGTRYFITDDGLPVDAKDPVIDMLYGEKLRTLPGSELKEVHRIPKHVPADGAFWDYPRYLVNDVVFYRVGNAVLKTDTDYDQTAVHYRLMEEAVPFSHTVAMEMGRLVQYMVKLYVKRHPNTTIRELRDVFSADGLATIAPCYSIENGKYQAEEYFTELEDLVLVKHRYYVAVKKQYTPREFFDLLVRVEKYRFIVAPDWVSMGDH